MEVLVFLLIVVLIIITINQNSKLTRHLHKVEDELKLLRRQLLKPVEKPEIPAVSEEEPKPATQSAPYKSIFTVTEDPAPVKMEESLSHEPAPQKIPQITETVRPSASSQPKKPSLSFFERNPDLEKFIGENLVSKIGIAILVLAIGFFVKYAIDKNWIGPIGRVSVGVICGGILVSLAHKLRNSYKNFSSVLAGGGIAAFYFTITLGFQQFQLFGQATAFIIMIVITAFAVMLSLLYDKQELAIIGLIGGFAAPFLVSTGSGNYKVLFTYLIILDCGLLILAYHKAWRLLNLLCFIFTIVLFGSWLASLGYAEPGIIFRNGFLFGIAFYILFFIINIAHNVKEKKKFIASDFGILLANTSLFFAAGLFCLNRMHAAEFRGLFSAAMGIFNLVISWVLFRKEKVDSNILYLLIGITLTFISITAPIQLHGNFITIFWASEASLLYWLFMKSNIRIIKYSSLIVWVLMLISLFMDWIQIYALSLISIAIIANKGFITTLFSAIATYSLFLLRNSEDKKISVILYPQKNIFRIAAIVLLFIAGVLEINYQFDYYYPGTGINAVYIQLYTLAFISIFSQVTQRKEQLKPRGNVISTMFSACILFYLIGIPQIAATQRMMLTQHTNGAHFLAHWLSALIVAFLIYQVIAFFRQHKTMHGNTADLVAWVICLVGIIYVSTEMHLLSNSIFYNENNSLENIKRIYIKTGLPILWSISSFIFMWLGMHYKYRTLRIVSLSLFLLTLLKLFIFDIRNIPAAGKIAAFFCLGVLLLVVSFMYQRLKKIIIDNEEKPV